MKQRTASHYLGIIATLAILALVVSGCTAPAGNPADGKRWYNMHNCYSCHGPNGDDGKAPELRGQGIGWRTFHAAVRNVGSPIMPKYPESKISKQDVADMYAWLTTK